MLVLDASVAVHASLTAAGFDLFRGEELVAPPLLRSEAVSALHELAWRGEVPAPDARIALDRILGAPIRRRRPKRLAREAWKVADTLGWAKTYDAEYVALARILKCRLLTIDARLKRGASRLVEILGPADL